MPVRGSHGKVAKLIEQANRPGLGSRIARALTRRKELPPEEQADLEPLRQLIAAKVAPEGIREFLRLHDVDVQAYANGLAARRLDKPRPAPDSGVYETWLATELNEAVDSCAEQLHAQGLTAQGFRNLCRNGSRRDGGHTWLLGLFSNSAAYLPGSLAAMGVGLGLAPVIGPFSIVAAAGVGLVGAYVHAAHSLCAGAEVGKLMDEPHTGRGSRERFSKVGKADRMGKALLTEFKAELAGRTLPRLAINGALGATRLALKAGHVASASVCALGYVMGPVAALIGPPTNACMQVLSRKFKGRDYGKTLAPLAGIRCSGEDGIAFDKKHLDRMLERLAEPAWRSAWRSCKRLAGLYKRKYWGFYKEERKKGMTFSKCIEVACGGGLGAAVGSAFALGVGADLAAHGGVTQPLSVGQSALVASGALLTNLLYPANVVTRGPVQQQVEKKGWYQRLKRWFEGAPAESGEPTPAQLRPTNSFTSSSASGSSAPAPSLASTPRGYDDPWYAVRPPAAGDRVYYTDPGFSAPTPPSTAQRGMALGLGLT